MTEDAEYTAQFDSTVNKYTVTFKDEDGSILKAATEYDYNTAAADIVKPADPTKEADDTYFYTFAGWDSTIVDVTDDAVYTATYTPTEIDSDFAIIKEVISVSSDIVAYTDDEGIPESIPTAKVGDTITWKITLVNQGNVAQTFTLSDILTYEGSETAITGVTVTADEGSPAITEGQVTLEAAGEDGFTTATYTATYVVGVNDAGKTLINTAVAGNGRDDDEKDPADGVKVEYPLELSKTVDKTDAKVGNTITYTITVKNTGNKDLSDVVITDTFNGNGTLSFTNTDNVTFADGKFTIKTLAVGKPETITVKYVAASGDANKTVTNTVASELDGNKDDDSVSTKITKKNKPSTPIPDTPPALNNTDHFAYIIGYPDGTVKPAGNITRAEVATIFFRLLTDDARDLFWATENEYSDVAANQWFNNAISTLSNAGIINGYEDGTFRPNAPITRAEFAKIAASFFNYAEAEYQGLFSDVPANKWYALYVEAASDLGLVTGYPDGTFLPEKSITRAEACTIVNRTIERNPHEDQLHEDMIVWVDNPAPGEDGHEWYYEQVQEATNSHDYELVNEYENWVEILENRDWAALEQAWSDSNSAPGGEVM